MTERNRVQAIAVVPGTHYETVAAVAIASAAAMLTAVEAGTGVVHEPWASWLAGPFTKSVRRIKTSGQESRITADGLTKTRFQVGGAIAYAYDPMTYDDFPKHLRSLQVSGLDVDRSLDAHPDRYTARRKVYRQRPVLSISSDTPMTTGKTAAQAAHALMLWALTLTAEDAARWAADEVQPFALEIRRTSFLRDDPHRDAAAPGRIAIRDNGLTEVAPGTETVRVHTAWAS